MYCFCRCPNGVDGVACDVHEFFVVGVGVAFGEGAYARSSYVSASAFEDVWVGDGVDVVWCAFYSGCMVEWGFAKVFVSV